MKIKVIRAFYVGGVSQPVGSVLDLARQIAIEMIALGKAEAIADAPEAVAAEPATAKARRSKKEMIA